MITVALWYVSESGSVSPPALLLSFNIGLTVLGLLPVHLNFHTVTRWDFDCDYVESVDQVGKN